MAVGASEVSGYMAYHWPRTYFASGARLREFRAGILMHGIHFSVIAAEQHLFLKAGRRGVNLFWGGEIPFLPPCFHVDRMQLSRQGSRIQSGTMQNGRGTNGTTDARLPASARGRGDRRRSLPTGSRIVLQQSDPLGFRW